MKIVITGATGNVGTSLLDVLSTAPEVTEIVGIARRKPDMAYPKTHFVAADVAKDRLEMHFRGAAAVVHLAWLIQPIRDPQLLKRVNEEGSRRVFLAAAAADVPTIVHASSVGAYSAAPKDRLIDENWDTAGIAGSLYSEQKAAVERQLDAIERDVPELRVVRLRPALTFKRGAASELKRYFVGRLVPSAVFARERIPFVPDIPDLLFQAVHTLDVARAYRLALLTDVRGAFNIAAEPVITPERLSRLLHARRVRIRGSTARMIAAATYRMRLQPSHPSWLDLALKLPIMDTDRARRELGWEAQYSALDALMEVFEGLHDRAGMRSPPLAAEALQRA